MPCRQPNRSSAAEVSDSKADYDDSAGWDPIIGERAVALHWSGVRELLERWFVETPCRRELGDSVLVEFTGGRPLQRLCRRLMRGIRCRLGETLPGDRKVDGTTGRLTARGVCEWHLPLGYGP